MRATIFVIIISIKNAFSYNNATAQGVENVLDDAKHSMLCVHLENENEI